MEKSSKKLPSAPYSAYLFKALLVLAVIFFSFTVLKEINLATIDLGRHLKNGELIASGNADIVGSVLRTNLYSYTMPDSLFINHHWASGLIFYAVYEFSNFSGLSIFYLALSIAAFLLAWHTAKQKSNSMLALTFSIFLLPLIAARSEIRPEVFTYFFTTIFFYVLSSWHDRKLPAKWLFLLPFLELLWVNLHLGFILGFAVIAAFAIEELVRLMRRQKNHFTLLLAVGISSLAASFINPNGIAGTFYFMKISGFYSYRIVENQSVSFLTRLNMTEGMHFLIFQVALVATAVSFILVAWKNRPFFPIANFVVALLFGILSYSGIRHFPSFALLALPIIAQNCALLISAWPKTKKFDLNLFEDIIAPIVIFLAIFGLVDGIKSINRTVPAQGFGLLDGVNNSAEFFKQHNISGPIFNNYDIGGYLIYHLYPESNVFVDNRPEAYTPAFFNDVYIPMQEDEGRWNKSNEQYNFNAIFFSHRDNTPWGQQFLVNRIKDDQWAVVYLDPHAIIMLKRNDKNKPVIEQFEIPKSRFSVQ